MATRAILTARDEEILKAVHYYRYMTARDVTNLLFSETSITHVREILAKLSGSQDLSPDSYLTRFTLPAVTDGAKEKVYALGARGRRVLRNQGLPVLWYFKLQRFKFLSYSFILHNLILTRMLIAAAKWAGGCPDFSLIDKRISYELGGKVIPDGWLLFEEKTDDGIYEQPVVIEIDRGMELKPMFKKHVRGRINYVQSGMYKQTFNTDVVTIAYATTGQTAEYREARRRNMCLWIGEVLQEMRLKDWEKVFKVASVEFQNIYDNSLFEEAVWYRPDQEKAVRLFS